MDPQAAFRHSIKLFSNEAERQAGEFVCASQEGLCGK